jgi:hypothetical protein
MTMVIWNVGVQTARLIRQGVMIGMIKNQKRKE